MKPEHTTNTSPITPWFVEEAWRAEPPPKLLPELQAELAALKAKLASGQPSGMPVDGEAERVYLAACAAKKGQASREPGDDQDF